MAAGLAALRLQRSFPSTCSREALSFTVLPSALGRKASDVIRFWGVCEAMHGEHVQRDAITYCSGSSVCEEGEQWHIKGFDICIVL
jgi:hypothetical protein